MRMKKSLPQVSVVVPTRNRPGDLDDLLQCLYSQRRTPFQLIIVDGSSMGSAKIVVESFRQTFRSKGCRLSYVRGGYDGGPTARNLGVRYAKGDAVLFLDDDTLPDAGVIDAIVKFLQNNPSALGAQARIARSGRYRSHGFAQRLWNAMSEALMLTYEEKNRMDIRRSVVCITPSPLTKVISAQALFGCASCYRRIVFERFSFDTNLKRWGYLDDVDFSYRVHVAYPGSLYVIPHAMVLHKASPKSRLPKEQLANMQTIYGFYVFFKNFSDDSILNLPAFLWAQVGRLLEEILSLIVRRKPVEQWWELVYLLRSYLLAFKHLKEILRAELSFFNDRVTATP